MINHNDKNPNFDKAGGLIPAIVQHHLTGQVLMLAYMNQAAYTLTKETGSVTFFSRSRDALWIKGETSGNTLKLIAMHLDCDQDTILVLVQPAGPACHLNTPTCFGDGDVQGHFLGRLAQIIQSRIESGDENSYSVKLMAAGMPRMAQKVGEEGVEIALASVTGTKEDLAGESADFLYHLLMLLQARGLNFEDVLAVLDQRNT